jgi:glutamyl-tRNA synthetase
MGILPDALINYLVRLGWSHGDQEFFRRDELIAAFDLEHLGRSAGVFDMDKLLALNADHIKACAPGALARHLVPHLAARGISGTDAAYVESLIPTLQPRSKTLVEMAEAAGFYFEAPCLDGPAGATHLGAGLRAPMERLHAELAQLDDFGQAGLSAAFQRVLDAHGLKLGKLAQPLRVALTGKTVSPGIFEIIAVLGKQQVLSRLAAALRVMSARDQAGGPPAP